MEVEAEESELTGLTAAEVVLAAAGTVDDETIGLDDKVGAEVAVVSAELADVVVAEDDGADDGIAAAVALIDDVRPAQLSKVNDFESTSVTCTEP